MSAPEFRDPSTSSSEPDYQDWYIEVSSGLKRRTPAEMIRLRELETWRKKFDPSAELYSSVFRYRSEDPYEGPVIAGFFADFDSADDIEKARKEARLFVRYLMDQLQIPEQSIDITFTGSKGFAIFINRRVFRIEPDENLPLIFKAMAKKIKKELDLETIDTTVYERRRLWRMPNSRHPRSGLYKIRLTRSELETLPVEKIRDLAMKPREIRQIVEHQESPIARAFYLKHHKETKEWLEQRKPRFERKPGTILKPDEFLICARRRLEAGSPEGTRELFAFQLAVYFAIHGMNIEEARKHLNTFNFNCVPPLEEQELEHALQSAYQGAEKGYYVGCGSEAFCDLCDITNCQLVQAGAIPPPIREKAEALLRDPDLLNKILQISEKRLVKDETTRTLEILVIASIFGPSPLNLNLSQIWSSGRSKITNEMASFLPDRHVWFLGSLSPTALVHERADWDEKEKAFIVNLDKKLLVFLENPNPKTLEALRPLLSHDRREIMYRFTDRTPKGTLRTIVAMLRGWPAVVFCGSKMPATDEYASRWLTASPEISGDKVIAVISRKGQEYKTPKMFEKGEEFIVVSAAFQMLGEGEGWKVTVPFGDLVAKHFRKKQATDMRRFDHFMQLIMASTVLHAFQREKDEDENLKSELNDVEIAYRILRPIEETSVTGLGQHMLDLWQALKEELKEEKGISSISYNTAIILFREKFQRSVSKAWLYEGYLKPLEQASLIDFEEDPEDKRKKNIVVLESKEEPLFNFEGFMKDLKMRASLKGEPQEPSRASLAEVEPKAEKNEEPEEESAVKEASEQKASPAEGRTCGDCVFWSNLTCEKHPDWKIVTQTATYAASCEHFQPREPGGEVERNERHSASGS
jgi:phage-related protein